MSEWECCGSKNRGRILGREEVKGENNPADALTKNLQRKKLVEFTEMAGQKHREGRAEASLVLAIKLGGSRV